MLRMDLISVVLLSLIGRAAVGQAQAPSPQQCESTPNAILRVEKPGTDWTRGLFVKSQVLMRAPFKATSDEDSGLTTTAYAVTGKPVILPYITADPCGKTAILSDLVLKPTGIMGVERNGRTFAYIASGKIASSSKRDAGVMGAEMNIVFYDVHGLGVFDTVPLGSSKRLPYIPQWAK